LPQIEDQRIIAYGSGSAGLGIARQLRAAMRLSSFSLSEEEAVDKNGLIEKSLGDQIRGETEQDFIRQEDDWKYGQTGLLDVVRRVKPTVLIGTSTHGGAFTEEVVKEMCEHVDRPIIFPVRIMWKESRLTDPAAEQPDASVRGRVRFKPAEL
jgi:malate dehydrogenase (oxaloacetate-decarboxylating)